MKKKKNCNRQLTITFDIEPMERIDSFDLKVHQFPFEQSKNVRVIRFQSYQTEKEKNLINRFYSLSDHLD